jgi:hypothetical protein
MEHAGALLRRRVCTIRERGVAAERAAAEALL